MLDIKFQIFKDVGLLLYYFIFSELAPQQFYYVPTTHPEMRGMPFVAPVPPHTVFFPAMDPQLPFKIVNQIDYYFR